MTTIPVLQCQDIQFGGNAAYVTLDSRVDTVWTVALNGTTQQGDRVNISHMIVDNTGNNATVYVDYGFARYSVSPYTRKTFPVLNAQNYVSFTISLNTVPITFVDFDPGLPDDVNQVATGGGGTGGVSGVTWSSSDKAAELALSNGNLTVLVTSLASVSALVRATTGKATGKFHFEMTVDAGVSVYPTFGIADTHQGLNDPADFGGTSHGIEYQADGRVFYNNASLATIDPFGNGAVIACEFDADNKLVWFQKLGGSGRKGPYACAGIDSMVFPAVAMKSVNQQITGAFSDASFKIAPTATFVAIT